MDWVWNWVLVAGSAVIGFLLGRLSARLDRRAAARDRDADWAVEFNGMTKPDGADQAESWLVTNTGTAAADEVRFAIHNGTVLRRWDTQDITPGETELIFVPKPGDRNLAIMWKTPHGVKRGPVFRLLWPSGDRSTPPPDRS